jgi:glycosyltransferase involved in cell wall biosynthesis
VRLLAIIPCFNEEAHVARVVREVLAARPGIEALVVDDGSSDRTGALAAAAGATVVTLPYNTGIGTAVQTGYRYAKANDFDVAVQIDGDGQHDPAQLEALLAPLVAGESDLAVGSRFLRNEGFVSTPLRRVGIRSFSLVLSAMVGARLSDPTSGFRAANRRVISLFASLYPEDYPEVESLYLAHRVGLRIREVPTVMRPRSAGQSTITPLRSVYYMVKVMFVLFIWLLRKKPTVEVP